MSTSRTSLAALDEALSIARQSRGRITLLHIAEELSNETVYSNGGELLLTDGYREPVKHLNRQLQQLVPADARYSSHVETKTVLGFPHDAIASTARKDQCDLIVIGLPQRPRVESLVMRSTVRTLLRQPPCAVLMVPGPLGMAGELIHPMMNAVSGHLAHTPVVAAGRGR